MHNGNEQGFTPWNMLSGVEPTRTSCPRFQSVVIRCTKFCNLNSYLMGRLDEFSGIVKGRLGTVPAWAEPVLEKVEPHI